MSTGEKPNRAKRNKIQIAVNWHQDAGAEACAEIVLIRRMMGDVHRPKKAYMMVHVMLQPEEQVFTKKQNRPIGDGTERVLYSESGNKNEHPKRQTTKQQVKTYVEQIEIDIDSSLLPGVKLPSLHMTEQYLQRNDNAVDGDAQQMYDVGVVLVHGRLRWQGMLPLCT